MSKDGPTRRYAVLRQLQSSYAAHWEVLYEGADRDAANAQFEFSRSWAKELGGAVMLVTILDGCDYTRDGPGAEIESEGGKP